jgi:hypothetical protein
MTKIDTNIQIAQIMKWKIEHSCASVLTHYGWVRIPIEQIEKRCLSEIEITKLLQKKMWKDGWNIFSENNFRGFYFYAEKATAQKSIFVEPSPNGLKAKKYFSVEQAAIVALFKKIYKITSDKKLGEEND